MVTQNQSHNTKLLQIFLRIAMFQTKNTTATKAIGFIRQHGFCGLADKQPMESLHADWERLYFHYRCCKCPAIAI